MAKIVLLGATFSTGNLGVHALTAGSITAALEAFPDAEVYLLDYGKEKVNYQFRSGSTKIPVSLLNMRYSKKIYLSNNVAVLMVLALLLKLVPSGGLRKRLLRSNLYFQHIGEAEIVASIAGGDSFSDIYGLGRLIYVSLPQLLVLLVGKRIVLLPQTLGPFNGRLARRLAKYILKRAALVYSRDRNGLEEMKDFLGPDFQGRDFRLCYDVGFVVEPRRPAIIDLGGIPEEKKVRPTIIGLNVSGLLYQGGYTRDNMFGLKIDYQDLIDSLIRLLIEKYNATVLLVPHVFGEAGQNSESDQAVCEAIHRELRPKYAERIYLAHGNYDQSEIKYIIGLCDFFIGSRMHACIAALSQNIPTVSIAYSKKFKGVMETIGVENYVADPRMMEKEEILNIVERGYSERDGIRRHLERKMPEVKARVLNLFKEIAEVVKI